MAFTFECDWRSGFVMNPEMKQRVGYLVKFNGLNMGEYLKEDIDVFTPYNSTETGYSEVEVDSDDVKVTCVGIMESFHWEGGVGDPVCISSYISAENAEVLSAKMKATLDTTIVSELAWWIVNFDEENKVWYEEAYPLDPSVASGQLNAPGGKEVRLNIGAQAVKIAPNIDINVYPFYFEAIPAANTTYNFNFATSLKTKFVKNWGIKIGTNAEAAMG
ncbi:MAG: hypothetical protein AAFV29_22340 [Myxococcota bacterium]